MSSPKITEYSGNYQHFNDDANISLEQDISHRSCQKYGSMLSCSSTENHVNSPIENIKTDHFIHKFETDDVLRENMSENAVLPSHDSLTDHELHWEMNYHEAAIFLEEGRNNEKFDSHPKHPEDLPAYLLVHNNWYYGLDLLTSLILLILALAEEPAVPMFQIPVWVHGSIELFSLIIIGIELALKLRWIGWSTMLKHKRTMLKCITLVIMFLEAMTVLVRQSSHFRVTRALRPIFLVDTKCFGGVRRFIRQILLTLPPILDMLGLLLFFITLYTVLGYYMFSEMNRNFSTLQDSFVSLFVLLTTANFPDVMMPSYSKNKWYAIYFVSYLSTMLYVMMNLMLAVVNETFTAAERDKFKKLFLHKRKACQHAFKLLVSKQSPDKMRFRQFEGLMRYYAPNKNVRDIILMYQHLNASGSGVLSIEEFLNIYDTIILQWEPQYSTVPWYHSTSQPLQILCTGAHAAIRWSYFETLMYIMIIANGIAMIIRILEPANNVHSTLLFAASWDTFLFGGIFVAEALIKVLGLGTRRYLSSGWNLFDLGTSIMTLVAACILCLFPTAKFFVLFRPLRLLRLFKMKKRYRDVFGTLVILTPLMSSTAVVMLVLYYFFAIIGMELFAGYNMRNCCKNTTVEDFYKYSANESTALGYYYLNTFDNLIASVSSFLEAFRFRIHYKKSTSKRDEEKMLHEEVELKWDELQYIIEDFQLLEKLRPSLIVGGTTVFIGSRPRTREVLQRKMYTNEITEWIAEAKQAERQFLSNTIHNVDENHREDAISESDYIGLTDNSRQIHHNTSNIV
ncbi:two pore calcium channel protein 1 isoform X2 [Apis mellifera]|uniref:Two pore calcium channel protein 1 isoform X2 n=1 Tax=Apis mellifera TaxID=7460 RepID=A0A7M7L2S7_APIME|nr:two pore calcium channel protein 1 isoform X2 [Apis mellifera]|eukprot:XP_026296691.1 two pore calcium channel protein 1 isoform X2 [Apis mellifera]